MRGGIVRSRLLILSISRATSDALGPLPTSICATSPGDGPLIVIYLPRGYLFLYPLSQRPTPPPSLVAAMVLGALHPSSSPPRHSSSPT